MNLWRFQYLPPWRLSRWGFVRGLWGRGCDEWHNPSVYLVVPLLGQLVVFYGRLFNRKGPWHAHAWTDGKVTDGIFYTDCRICVEQAADIASFHARRALDGQS